MWGEGINQNEYNAGCYVDKKGPIRKRKGKRKREGRSKEKGYPKTKSEHNYNDGREDMDAWRSGNELTQGYWNEELNDYVTSKVANKARGQTRTLRLRCDREPEE